MVSKLPLASDPLYWERYFLMSDNELKLYDGTVERQRREGVPIGQMDIRLTRTQAELDRMRECVLP